MAQTLRILTLATLFPNSACPNFGIFVGRQTAMLAQREDVEVTVVNPIGLPPFPLSRLSGHRALTSLPRRDNWQGLTVDRPRFLSIPRWPSRNPKAIARAVLASISEEHAKQPFDLIDAEFFWPDGPAAMMIADALGLPFTIKARGFDIHHWGNTPHCRELILQAAEKAGGVLAVSEALKRDMVKLGIDSRKITVHYTGIDKDIFEPQDRAAAKAKLSLAGPVISSVGALIPRKRQHLLIEALPELPNATLVLIGQGPDKPALRGQAESLGLSDRVRFTGPLPHEQIAEYLAASDVMALVSSAEGLANGWVEALASGTPVIACDVGGARELIRNESAGRIVEPTSGGIVKAAKALLVDPPEQQTVRHAIAHMSWDKNATELEQLFRSISGK